MKLVKVSLLLFAIVLTGCQKKKESLTPEEISTKVFKMLQNFDNENLEGYKKDVITFEELKELANDKDMPLDETVRNDFKATGTKDYEEAMARDFGGLTADASQYKIEWRKIKFVSFKERVQEMGVGKAVIVEIFFSMEDRKFSIKAIGVFDGKGYRIIKIGDLRQTYS